MEASGVSLDGNIDVIRMDGAMSTAVMPRIRSIRMGNKKPRDGGVVCDIRRCFA